MEICLAIIFTALFPLVTHTSWGLSDCVVDGNFRMKFSGLRQHEVYLAVVMKRGPRGDCSEAVYGDISVCIWAWKIYLETHCPGQEASVPPHEGPSVGLLTTWPLPE